MIDTLSDNSKFVKNNQIKENEKFSYGGIKDFTITNSNGYKTELALRCRSKREFIEEFKKRYSSTKNEYDMLEKVLNYLYDGDYVPLALLEHINDESREEVMRLVEESAKKPKYNFVYSEEEFNYLKNRKNNDN
jgi:hypothetical protein